MPQTRTCEQCGKQFKVKSGRSQRQYCALCAGKRMVEGKKPKETKKR